MTSQLINAAKPTVADPPSPGLGSSEFYIVTRHDARVFPRSLGLMVVACVPGKQSFGAVTGRWPRRDSPGVRRAGRAAARSTTGAGAGDQAAALALYGLRLQAQGISPGPVEAVITITDRHGCYLGQLDIDAGDAQFMVDAISGLLGLHYGPWTSQDADRLRASYRAEPPP